MIDFSVPNDVNVEIKEPENIEKYTPLAHEIRKMNHVSVKTVPLVVGVLGVVLIIWKKFFRNWASAMLKLVCKRQRL